MAGYHDLTIADNDYTNARYGARFNDFNNISRRYKDILNAICEGNTIYGAHAAQLQRFLDFFRQQLHDQLKTIAGEQDANMAAYLSEIDDADKSLY